MLVLLALCLYACATPSAPQGGSKDETPPALVNEKSTPNYQTNYRPKTIELSFDEWIKLDNINQQLLISPPFDGATTRLKGKTLILDFGTKDTLRDDVTYVVQFGKAVKDLTEGNVADELKFVFSTGDQIDSLVCKGEVKDAYTGKAVEDALILVYDNLADSVFRTQRPLYFGRSDKNGAFEISNMKAGQYKICALVDQDANYKYSQATEQIAFLNENYLLSADSSSHVELKMFQESIPLQALDEEEEPGLLKLTYNQDPTAALNIVSDASFQSTFTKDTAYIWYPAQQAMTLFLSAKKDTFYRDTISIKAFELEDKTRELSLINDRKKSLYPAKSHEIAFSLPIHQLDTSLITLVEVVNDSTENKLAYTWAFDSLDQRRLLVSSAAFKEKSKYKWVAYPNALTDYWAQSHTDTLTYTWSTAASKDFGNIIVDIQNAQADQAYLFKLMFKEKELKDTFFLLGQSEYTYRIDGMPAGDYHLEVILDQNQNKEWDSGNYDHQQQAEKVLVYPLDKLRSNWDLEVDLDLGEL